MGEWRIECFWWRTFGEMKILYGLDLIVIFLGKVLDGLVLNFLRDGFELYWIFWTEFDWMRLNWEFWFCRLDFFWDGLGSGSFGKMKILSGCVLV